MNELPLAPASAAADRAAAAHSWHWYAPRLALGVFAATLLSTLWILHRHELEERRQAVIRDALWVEQNLQFSLERGIEQLAHLVPDAGAPVDQRQLELHVRHMMESSPGLVQVVLLDPGGAPVASAPGPVPQGAPWVTRAAETAYELARRTGKATYGPPRRSSQDWEVDVFVPKYRAGVPAGTVVGVYRLHSILASLVPWWLTEKHRVTIRDASGAVLAAKSNVAPGRAELTYQAPLDPPGYGLVLHVESYGSATNLLRNALGATILGLAAAVFWSMWSLRRHVQRRLATEDALRQEHAFRKAMEDSLETGMRAVDLEGRVVYVNPAFCRMVGHTEGELIGHAPPQPYWPPDQRRAIEDALRGARAPGAPRAALELELVRRGGERFDALLYEAPLVDARGRQTGWMGSMLDITERKRARERARQQEEKLAVTARLVTMGEMASTLAHELNQPLSAITSYSTACLNLLEAGGADAAELQEALRRTQQQAQRAGQIIRRVHEFVRHREPSPSRVRLNAVLEEALSFAQAEARKRHVTLRAGLLADDAELEADPLLLQQVLLNLLRNGMDAMAATPPEQRVLAVTAERGGAGVTVRVADRGCGLSREVAAQLFEPFFTTKREGMGMGLNICRSILELHRGRVWAEPNPEGGAVFCVSLPLEVAA